jgi:glycosyltransferase involved in cell wall biosynthesis
MNEENDNTPLVSVIVITYNSSKFVLETLESVKRQTYQNIELIVSDDCSTDNTFEICFNWIEKHQNRFIRTKAITTEKNTGISPNCNRGVKVSAGKWLKLIAGDDILCENAISDYIAAINREKSKTISFIFGGCQYIRNGIVEQIVLFPDSTFKTKSARCQFISLITKGNQIHGPTSFMRYNALKYLDYFDEEIPLSEDWPLWIKATKNNFKLHFIDTVVAYYRIHEHGIFSKTLVNIPYDKRLNKAVNQIRRKYILPNLVREKKFFQAYHNWLVLKKETVVNSTYRLVYKMLLITSPIFIKNIIYRQSSNLWRRI